MTKQMTKQDEKESDPPRNNQAESETPETPEVE